MRGRKAPACPSCPPSLLRPARRSPRDESWARTPDRAARTAPARAARRQQFLDRARELQGPEATAEAVEQAAGHLYKADMARMSLKATKARQAKARARRATS